MKKVLSLQSALTWIVIALVSALLSITLPTSATATTVFVCTGGTYTVDGAGTLTSAQGCTGDLVIDSSVLSIADYAFYFNPTSINTLTIPNSVTSVGTWAFFAGTAPQIINIGTGLSAIGANAFGSQATREINILEGNLTFSSISGVLFNKNQTTLIVYPAGRVNTSYTIPSTVLKIENSAFYGGRYLESVIIPDSVTTLAGGTFQQNTSLRSITLGSGISAIPDATFYNNFGAGITEVIFSSSTNLKVIGGSAFLGAKWSSLVIPEGVTTIGGSAFGENSNLVDLRLPITMTTLDDAALNLTPNLTKVCYLGSDANVLQAITNNGKTVGCVSVPDAPGINGATAGNGEISIAFTPGSDNGSTVTNYLYSLDGATYQPFSPANTTSPVVVSGLSNDTPYTITLKALNAVGAGAASTAVSSTPRLTAYNAGSGDVNCGTSGYFTATSYVISSNSSCLGTVDIPTGITDIALNAFIYAGVTTMTIPASVTTITGTPFNCTAGSLTSITVDPTNPNYSSTNGVLFDKLQTEILVYPASKAGVSYAIPTTVQTLRSCSFAKNKFLTSMALPDTLLTLGATTFLEAESLQTVSIGAGLSSWGSQSFTRNYSLTSFTIDPSNASFTSLDGIAYNKNITTLVAYPIGKVSTSYTPPITVSSTEQALFVDSLNLLNVDFSTITNLDAQAFMGSAIKEVILGNSLTSIPVQTFQNAMVLERVTFGTGLTSIDPNGFFNNFKLNCIVYPGSNAVIQNFIYPNLVVPVANSSLCPGAPSFTLSASSVTAVTGAEITGYTITSTGGAIASYSISPAISNTPGLSFSTSTGLISGTPTTAAGSTTYTITATNATGPAASQTFAITVIDPAPVVVYVPPVPVPYLKTLATPKMNLKDSKLICTPGTYNTGYAIDGVIQGSATSIFTPATFTYNLLINGILQRSLSVTTATSSTSWDLPAVTFGSLISCSVTVSANSLTNTDKSTDNTSAVSPALSTQTQSIKVAGATYSAAVTANSKAYQKALVDNRATWRKEIDAIRSNYYDTLNRIKANGGSKMIADTSTALKIMIAAQKKSAADYTTSKPAALATKDAANQTALDVKTAAIANANAIYGAFIESIGLGVLIPEEVTKSADNESVEVAKPTPTPSPTPTPTPTPSPKPTTNPQPSAEMAIVGTVYMATGSYQLSPDAKKRLIALAKTINSSAAKTILVYGHTDIRGGVNNTLLSQNRAKAVAAFLRPLLTIKKISIGWYASRKPAATGSTSADLALNRRVEIYTK